MKWRVLMGLLAWSGADASPARHVVHLVFENADGEEVAKVPSFRRFMDAGTYFSNSRAVAHPSQPNYIAMIGGSTRGVFLDGEVTLEGRHLGDLLEEKGFGWKAYAEDYPGNCFLGMRSGKYVRKHVPFLSFTSVQKVPSRCARVVRLEQFFSDLKSGSLPEYSMVIPNLDHDGHDTDVEFAGRWFWGAFGAALQDPWVKQNVWWIITFDESESYLGSNQIFTVILGAGIPAGRVTQDPVDHYSFLRLIEDLFGLGSLNRNDLSASRVPDFIYRIPLSEKVR